MSLAGYFPELFPLQNLPGMFWFSGASLFWSPSRKAGDLVTLMCLTLPQLDPYLWPSSVRAQRTSNRGCPTSWDHRSSAWRKVILCQSCGCLWVLPPTAVAATAKWHGGWGTKEQGKRKEAGRSSQLLLVELSFLQLEPEPEGFTQSPLVYTLVSTSRLWLPWVSRDWKTNWETPPWFGGTSSSALLRSTIYFPEPLKSCSMHSAPALWL